MCTFAYGQVTKGNFLAGGAFSFQSEKYSEGGNRSTSLSFTPGAGYFFIDKAAAGLRSTLTYYKQDVDSRFYILAGPFLRYYFLPAPKSFNLFLDGSFMAGTEKYHDFDAESITQYAFNGGPSFFINRFVAVEATFGWRSLKFGEDKGRYNSFSMNIGFQLHMAAAKK